MDLNKTVFAAILSATVAGCASPPRTITPEQQMAKDLNLPLARQLASRGYSDPTAFLTAWFGPPIVSSEGGARPYWVKTSADRAEQVRQIEKVVEGFEEWCRKQKGTLKVEHGSATCSSIGNNATKYGKLGFNPKPDAKSTTFFAFNAEDIAKNDAAFQRQIDEHLDFVSSNGLKGSIRLKDGRQFPLVRAGTPNESTDFVLSAKSNAKVGDRLLRDVSVAVKEGSEWRIAFRDGTRSFGEYEIRGRKQLLRNNEFWTVSTTKGDMEGTNKFQMVLVIQVPDSKLPIVARILPEDLVEIRLEPRGGQKAEKIEVSTDTGPVQKRLMERWTEEAKGFKGPKATMLMDVLDRPLLDSRFCKGILTREEIFYCREIEREYRVFAPSPYSALSWWTTPLLLSKERDNTMAGRTLF